MRSWEERRAGHQDSIERNFKVLCIFQGQRINSNDQSVATISLSSLITGWGHWGWMVQCEYWVGWGEWTPLPTDSPRCIPSHQSTLILPKYPPVILPLTTTFVAYMSMISFTLISAPANNSIGLVQLCRFCKITVLAFAMFFAILLHLLRFAFFDPRHAPACQMLRRTELVINCELSD